MWYNTDMEKSAERKLDYLGIPRGYEAYSYFCSLITSHKASELSLLTLKEVEKELSHEFGVSEKAVIHNLTLLRMRAWSKGVFGNKMNWQTEPTLKEFVFSVLVMAEYAV